jgi:hypothetical protein
VQLFLDHALEAGPVSATERAVSATEHAVSATERAVSATERPVSATERAVSAKVSGSRESGSTDMHLDPVLLLARSLGAKLVARDRESDPKDTPLVPHAQEFVFLSTSRSTDLKRNAVRPEIVSMGQERVETRHIGTAASGRGALAHHRQENDENRPHHGDVIRPDVKKNFRFGPLRRGKFIFRLIKIPPYYRVDSVWMGVLLHHLYVDVHARWNGHHRRLYSCTPQQPQETSTHRPAIVSL